MRLALKVTVMALMIELLAGCGGSGGGSSSSDSPPPTVYADGLGVSGLATGTMVVGVDASNTNYSASHPSIALADNGKALVAWVAHAGGTLKDSLAWNQSDAGGQWGTAQSLALGTGVIGSWWDAITLRSNSAGDAVLGWLEQETRKKEPCGTEPCEYAVTLNRAARFIDGVGWDATKYDANGGSAAYGFSYPSNWDLAMLDDRSFVSSVTIAAPLSPASGSYVMRQPITGNSELLLGPLSAYYSTLAIRSDGDGVQYWGAPGTSGGYDVKGRFVSVSGVALGPFPIGTFRLCLPSDGFTASSSPFVAATSRSFHDTLAIVTAEPGGLCDQHDLELVRIDATMGISIRTTRANSPNTIIPRPPVVVMDSKGDALAVWKEAPYNDRTASARLMWSASLNGGEWSTPAPVIANQAEIGTIRQASLIALAMNGNGEAIASIVTEDADKTVVNPSVSVGRFNFSSGWSTWRRVANKTNISAPAVAINGGGAAIVAFTALDVDRVNGKAATGWSGGTTTKVFALRL